MEHYTVIGFSDNGESPWVYSVSSAGSPNEAITVAIQCMCREQGNHPDDYIVVEVIRGAHGGVGNLDTIQSGSNFADAEADEEEEYDEDAYEDENGVSSRSPAHAENRIGNPGVDY